MKIAVVHDWLTGMRGGEAILEAILEIFPSADLFTLLHVPGSVSEKIENRKITTSFLNSIPGIENRYRHFLPLMPYAVSTLPTEEYDLILSSSHCVAKGVRKRKNAIHLSYIHSPMRYIWDCFEDYFSKDKVSWFVRGAALSLRPFLQTWDRKTSQASIDHLFSNSHFISDRIQRAYGRESQVLYPFYDDTSFFYDPEIEKEDFYLMVGAFAPNKRVDLALEAFRSRKDRLVIIGTGQEKERLKKSAPKNVEFLGYQERSEISLYYKKAKAFLFPGIEDFGITPLEAMASGTPVVAYSKGGVLETVNEKTGEFFHEPKASSLNQAIDRLEIRRLNSEIDPKNLVDRSSLFHKERFMLEYKSTVNRLISLQ